MDGKIASDIARGPGRRPGDWLPSPWADSIARFVCIIVLAGLATAAFWQTFSAHLDLSSDEIFFYYLSVYGGFPGPGGFHAAIVEQLTAQSDRIIASIESQGASTGNFGDAMRYLPLQLNSLNEYPLAERFWSLFASAPPRGDVASLPQAMANSLVSMFVAAFALIVAIYAATMARFLPLRGCAALVIAMAFIFANETVFTLPPAFANLLAEPFLPTFDATLKDFRAFSFSARSNFLLLLPLMLVVRWEKGVFWGYVVLLFMTAWHASQGLTVFALLLGLDLVRHREKLFAPRLLLVLWLTVAFGLLSVMVPQDKRVLAYAFLVASALPVIAAGVLHPGWRASRGEQDLKASAGWDFAYLLLVAVVANYGWTMHRGLLPQGLSWTGYVLVLRLGSIFAVVAAACLSYALATVAFLIANGRARPLVAGAVAALAVFTALQLSTPDAWKPRVALIERMEARANAVNDSLKTPLSFVTSTELDRIWYAIVKSELDGTSYAPQLAVDSVGDPNR